MKAISASNIDDLNVSHSFDVKIVECNSRNTKVKLLKSTMNKPLYQLDPNDITYGQYFAKFVSSNSECPINSVTLITRQKDLKFPKPCDPRTGCKSIVRFPLN